MECKICGEQEKKVFELSFQDLIGMCSGEYVQKIGMCPNCGFIHTLNPFSQIQLANRYRNHSKFEFNSESYFLEEGDTYKKRCQRQKSFIERNIGSYNTILEVGASSGYNLSLYSEKEVLGIEPSPLNCKQAKKTYNISMICGTFEDYWKSNSGKKFDLIFLSHTLEHIVDPFHFIEQCSTINNHYIFIEVPTFDYKFIDEPYGMFAEEHVNCFTLEGLWSLMDKAGYALMDANMIFGIEQYLPAGWPAISTLWKKKAAGYYDLKPKPVLNSEILLENYIEKSRVELLRIQEIIHRIAPKTKLAIWGTGHHASMLLANTTLKEKSIVKFYDSDSRKHSYTMVGKPITAFQKEDIVEGNVDTVLVASYTAQKAISKILFNYEKFCDIIYLYQL